MSWFQTPRILLPDLIERHGTWRGTHTALIEGTRRLSWSQFARQTSQVAHGLRAAGLRQGDRVALLVDNSLELAVMLFGIIRSGCVAVPLNVAINDEAVAGMIEDCQARAIFASGRHCARIEGLAVNSAGIGRALKLAHESPGSDWIEFNAWREAQLPDTAAIRIDPEKECNIIYSSGTTGVPKGIVHTHGCRTHWAVEMATVLRYRSDAVVLCSLGLYSNISWVAMLAAIYVGCSILIMRSFDASSAVELMKREAVTHGNFVPLQLQQLLDLPDLEQRRPSRLDTLMVCGSPVRLEVKRQFAARYACNLIELYGLTEGFCTILAPEDFAAHTASVGKPFLGGELKIVGEDGHPVGPGVTGEIVGRSALLMAAYHNREDATREVTWIDDKGRRWLRTGDLGFVDEQGFLYVVDRKKDMILSGGQNIYPADIEQVMRAHPDIADVAVIAARSRKWGETPIAIVVPKGATPPDREALMAWTNERLGKQQRIADVFWREALPRNPNGKVLKRELRSELATREY